MTPHFLVELLEQLAVLDGVRDVLSLDVLATQPQSHDTQTIYTPKTQHSNALPKLTGKFSHDYIRLATEKLSHEQNYSVRKKYSVHHCKYGEYLIEHRSLL